MYELKSIFASLFISGKQKEVVKWIDINFNTK